MRALTSRVFAEYHIREVCEKVQITYVFDLRTGVLKNILGMNASIL